MTVFTPTKDPGFVLFVNLGSFEPRKDPESLLSVTGVSVRLGGCSTGIVNLTAGDL